MSHFSVEAEYRVMAITSCKLKWLKSLLSYLEISHIKPIQLYCDSQSALHIAQYPIYHECTKHIEVDCHFVRDELVSQNIATSYVPTGHQLVHILTKALGNK